MLPKIKEAHELRQLLSEELYCKIQDVSHFSKDDIISSLKNDEDFFKTVKLIGRLQKEYYNETL